MSVLLRFARMAICDKVEPLKPRGLPNGPLGSRSSWMECKRQIGRLWGALKVFGGSEIVANIGVLSMAEIRGCGDWVYQDWVHGGGENKDCMKKKCGPQWP